MAIEEEEECKCGPEREEWIYTYGDMVTLLMAFFILLFAMSDTNVKKFTAISASFHGGPPSSPYTFEGMPMSMENIEGRLRDSDLEELSEVTMEDRGIVVSFSDSVLFLEGTAEPTKGAQKVIEKFAKILYLIPNAIIIEGHTDDSPVSTPQFPSNWELSAGRSASVARMLEKFGIEKNRMQVVGYGDTRPRVANETPAMRAINRRIDVLIKPQTL